MCAKSTRTAAFADLPRQKTHSLHWACAFSDNLITCKVRLRRPHPGRGSTELTEVYKRGVVAGNGWEYLADEWLRLGGSVDATLVLPPLELTPEQTQRYPNAMHEPWHTGQTLLKFASTGNRAEHLGIVDMLLQRGATVNQQDEKGHTAVRYAIQLLCTIKKRTH